MKSFYWYFRPIAFGFNLLGIFPLSNILSLDTSKLSFHLCSPSYLYSFAILSSFCITIFYFYGFLLSRDSYVQLIQSFIVYGMLGRTVASFFIYGLRNFYQLPRLIQLLDTFDNKKNNVLVEYVSSWKKLLCWTIVPCFMIGTFVVTSLQLTSAIIFYILPKEMTESKFCTIFSYFFAYLVSREFYSSLLYIYFAFFINYGYRQINKTLVEKNIKPSYYKDVKYPADMYCILSKIRHLHNILSECVSQLSKVFGSFMAIDQFCVVVVLVINISVYVSLHAHFTLLLLLIILNAVLVAGVLLISHEVKTNVSTFYTFSKTVGELVISETKISSRETR